MSRNNKLFKKTERHQKLLDEIKANPFITDEELAEVLSVSIPTVRLDRLELAIPEVRKHNLEPLVLRTARITRL